MGASGLRDCDRNGSMADTIMLAIERRKKKRSSGSTEGIPDECIS
jgi:hypothetical protein